MTGLPFMYLWGKGAGRGGKQLGADGVDERHVAQLDALGLGRRVVAVDPHAPRLARVVVGARVGAGCDGGGG